MKLIWMVRTIAFLMIIGTVGSVEIDKIDFYTAFLQISLGLTLLILSNFWMREIKKSTLGRRKASVLVESMSYISTCILTQSIRRNKIYGNS